MVSSLRRRERRGVQPSWLQYLGRCKHTMRLYTTVCKLEMERRLRLRRRPAAGADVRHNLFCGLRRVRRLSSASRTTRPRARSASSRCAPTSTSTRAIPRHALGALGRRRRRPAMPPPRLATKGGGRGDSLPLWRPSVAHGRRPPTPPSSTWSSSSSPALVRLRRMEICCRHRFRRRCRLQRLRTGLLGLDVPCSCRHGSTSLLVPTPLRHSATTSAARFCFVAHRLLRIFSTVGNTDAAENLQHTTGRQCMQSADIVSAWGQGCGGEHPASGKVFHATRPRRACGQ